MRRTMIVVLSLVAALLATIAPARAITYGELDGNRHPNVGAIVAEWRPSGEKDLLCSGTLISPTVFLTAAHCTAFLESRGISEVWVTFDSHFDPATATLYPGVMYTNPAYSQRQDDTGDIAVIVLDQPITHLTPARLPTAGLFDQMAAQNGLKDQTFTAVGYGTLEPTRGNGRPVFTDNVDRRMSTSRFNALNKTFMRLSQNNATGDSGTCYGDSGGPNFLGTTDIIAGITITGDIQCWATNVIYRLDTQSTRDFLSSFVALP
ncbi:MAG TPA: trypsin-like serine protease [Herpetosiphonaceae bacterium]